MTYINNTYQLNLALSSYFQSQSKWKIIRRWQFSCSRNKWQQFIPIYGTRKISWMLSSFEVRKLQKMTRSRLNSARKKPHRTPSPHKPYPIPISQSLTIRMVGYIMATKTIINPIWCNNNRTRIPTPIPIRTWTSPTNTTKPTSQINSTWTTQTIHIMECRIKTQPIISKMGKANMRNDLSSSLLSTYIFTIDHWLL